MKKVLIALFALTTVSAMAETPAGFLFMRGESPRIPYTDSYFDSGSMHDYEVDLLSLNTKYGQLFDEDIVEYFKNKKNEELFSAIESKNVDDTVKLFKDTNVNHLEFDYSDYNGKDEKIKKYTEDILTEKFELKNSLTDNEDKELYGDILAEVYFNKKAKKAKINLKKDMNAYIKNHNGKIALTKIDNSNFDDALDKFKTKISDVYKEKVAKRNTEGVDKIKMDVAKRLVALDDLSLGNSTIAFDEAKYEAIYSLDTKELETLDKVEKKYRNVVDRAKAIYRHDELLEKLSKNSATTPSSNSNKELKDENIKSIKTNTDNIATNKTSIETNKTAIDKNTKDIKTNTDNIKEIKDNYVSKDKLSSEVKSAVEVAKNGGTKDEKGINIGAKIEETATIKSKSNVVVAVDSEDGKETKVIGSNNSVFGIGHKVTGNGNTVLGDPTHVDGDGNTILGNNNNVKGENNIVLGNDIKIENVNNAVVLGNKSEGESNTVSVGSKDNQRRIINVADAKRDTDAVNLRQLNKVEDKLAGGLASVTAMTSLDTTPVKVGKTKIAAAVGGYNSHQAVAVGVGKNMSEGLNINFKLGANIGKASNVTYSTGISYEF